MLTVKVKSAKNEIGNKVERRLKEFESVRRESNERIFQELAFCILTANSSARMGLKAQSEIGGGFVSYTEQELRNALHRLGYRFWRVRASYIVEARWVIPRLREILSMDEHEARMFLVRNVKGLGMKEASHFLRNTGAKNLAIVDRHILRVLSEHEIITMPKTLTVRRYLEVEDAERGLAKEAGMSLAELDLYLWYLKTGQVLK
ncbi:MAG: N-glycosylase/DNA lyase [Euryarchaeota archaeon]|nr:N-glycosylase/DNA lyase [Euryarchaeota archaeon]